MGIGGLRMQDRFKFRAYNKELRKMYEVDNICPYEDNHTKGGEVFLKGIQYNSFYFPEEVEVMQCTGLKDKNGKLIYEGDILKGKKDMICSPHSSRMVDKVGVVEIPQNMFVASCRDVKNNCTLFCQNDWVKTEVIGNIYQNPELLEE